MPAWLHTLIQRRRLKFPIRRDGSTDQPVLLAIADRREASAAAPIGGSRSRLRLRSAIFAAALRGFALPGRCGRPGTSKGWLSGCSGDERGDDVGGMPVKASACPVIAHRGARISVGCGLLHIPQRDPGVQGSGDERVPQRMGTDVLGDPGAAGNTPDDPGGAVPVQPPPVTGGEQRPFGAPRQPGRSPGRCAAPAG